VTAPPLNTRRRAAVYLVAGLLAVIAMTVFLPALNGEFLQLDDDQYVTNNRVVRGGITRAGLRWALTANVQGNWQPLTLLSHMTDVSVFGFNPRGHHLSSLLLHGANTALLFLLLRSLTGSLLPSALATALFAVHPLRVESVAWIAERKDVLSSFFALSSLLAYSHYARRTSPGRLLPVACLFALALMAKPMPVTLPFVMLLLDYWPLGRLFAHSAGSAAPASLFPLRLLLEKAPLFVLAAISSVVTILAQGQQAGAIIPLTGFGVTARLANSLLAYAGYLRTTFVPIGLAIPYPAKGSSELVLSHVIGAALLLLLLCAASILAARRHPSVIVGWLWFVGMLAPVSGIIQNGMQFMADRYTYLPSIGLAVALVWLPRSMTRSPRFHRAAAVATLLVLALLVPLTRGQIRHWRSTVALYEHSLEVIPDNYFPRFALGAYYRFAGDPKRSELEYREASRLRPDLPEPRYKLGILYASSGAREAALEEYRALLRMRSPLAENLRSFIEASDQLRRGGHEHPYP
jgi:hypothetical protein